MRPRPRPSRARAPRSLPPGDYEVVLEEFAVSDMLDFLGYVGFGGLAVEEGRSFMSGRLGEAVMGPNVTIWDDPLDPAGIPRPFDSEGAPARRTDLVRDGAAASPVHDRFTAAKAGTETTGHALPAHYSMGPIPRNMFLAPAALPETVSSPPSGADCSSPASGTPGSSIL